MEEYNSNMEFRDYVDRYCNKHGITPEEAVRHVIVKGVEEMKRHRRLEGCEDRRY